jgi:hypothetical protein
LSRVSGIEITPLISISKVSFCGAFVEKGKIRPDGAVDRRRLGCGRRRFKKRSWRRLNSPHRLAQLRPGRRS